jgi:hypothetical protein
MKSVSSALAAHLAGEVTTLATCWQVTRKDGREFFFTDHDCDLAFEDEIYLASSGYTRSAIANEAGMAVDNLDVEGVFDHEQISEQDRRAGLFDHAEVQVFLVNWADLSQGQLRLRRGWFGEVQLTGAGMFRTELRGLTQALNVRIGEICSPECRADLGDHRCRVPIEPPLIVRCARRGDEQQNSAERESKAGGELGKPLFHGSIPHEGAGGPCEPPASPHHASFRRLVASGVRFFHLLQDAAEVVGFGSLQRWELFIRQQMLLPQLLADRQHVPVVQERGHRGRERTADAHRRFLIEANRLLERIALDVLDQGEVERDQRQEPALRPGLRHGVGHLPVLVADRRRCRTRVVEKVVAR